MRSNFTCKLEKWVNLCKKCYGIDLSNHKEVLLRSRVIAYQSIGEPGTQLTMRTFHTGGVATGQDVQSDYRADEDGIIQFENVETFKYEMERRSSCSSSSKAILNNIDMKFQQDQY